ncbi:MAG: thiamine biosynthesis protein ThiS [Candidatus Aenigmarchaeota archaeon ex4484_52]|nr:MAG: thiamine biosynthesis protein ThiS [Candidatus Aenigmarchaeota archaeon ex4484_52]
MKTIFLSIGDKTEKISFFGSTIEDLLKLKKINAEKVLIKKNNEFITEDEALNNKDIIELINIVSKG